MAEAVRLYFRNYANFSGRTSRRHYWLAQVFQYLISSIFAVLSILLIFPILLWAIWVLANIIPSLSILVRRLHDRNLSGWFILLSLIPLGTLVLLVLTLLPGTPEANRFGMPYGILEERSVYDSQRNTDKDTSYSFDEENLSGDDWADF